MLFRRPNRKYLGGFLIFSGSICLVIAFVSFLYFWHFVQTAAHAKGRIVQMLEHRDGDHGTAFFPVFSFRDDQGAEYTIHSSSGSFPPEYEVGDTVPVLYSAANPKNAKIDSLFSIWGISLITGILGVIDLPIGLIVWFWPAIIGKFSRKVPVSVG
jgi:hypothetical protein